MYRRRHNVLCATLSLVTLLGGGAAAGQSLDRAERDYDAAMAATDDARRIELLTRSFAEYETYEAAIALGETLLGAGEWRRAREWLTEAYALGGTDESRARALFRIGESHATEGNRLRAVDYLREAGALYDLPMIRQSLREIRREAQGQIVSSEEIVAALTDTTRGARVRPRVDIHINFEFDSARMTRDGRAQARQLGEAMRFIADDARRLPEWLLVGHTDARGAHSYNASLSARRARAVRVYLVDEFGFDPHDIDVEGRGEDELLDREMTEAAHAVNRRVELVVR